MGGDLLQPAVVEHFHEERHGTADGPFAMFVAADGSKVFDPKQHGKAGL